MEQYTTHANRWGHEAKRRATRPENLCTLLGPILRQTVAELSDSLPGGPMLDSFTYYCSRPVAASNVIADVV